MDVVGSVYRTTEYEQFKRLKGNRKVDDVKIKKITNSINKVGYVLSPIVVNEKMEIIDGQNRVAALKALKKPVDFVIAEGAGIEECTALNINQTPWTLKDYIDRYAETGNVSYEYLQKLIGEFGPKYQAKVIINVVSGRVESATRQIKEGEFVCTSQDFERTRETLVWLQNFSGAIKRLEGHTEYYYMALAFCHEEKEIDDERLVERVNQRQAEMIPVTTIQQAFEVIEKMYNYRNRKIVYIGTIYRKHMDEKYKWYTGKYGHKYEKKICP